MPAERDVQRNEAKKRTLPCDNPCLYRINQGRRTTTDAAVPVPFGGIRELPPGHASACSMRESGFRCPECPTNRVVKLSSGYQTWGCWDPMYISHGSRPTCLRRTPDVALQEDAQTKENMASIDLLLPLCFTSSEISNTSNHRDLIPRANNNPATSHVHTRGIDLASLALAFTPEGG